ncbi:hypothetical protein BKA61DRAFT_582534 [Leptodontidium sp. MPI-SDFR-AT-0119]|nr:hypothetical protein BKA61DRAFT_582534 [Leptodontidium sp. MPI-SDFR-AT-0119]
MSSTNAIAIVRYFLASLVKLPLRNGSNCIFLVLIENAEIIDGPRKDPRMAKPLMLGPLHRGGVSRPMTVTVTVTVTDVRARTSWGRSGTRMNVPWDPIDEQRLLAYKKEGKSWKWIFRQFQGRTENSVRQRSSIVKRRGG